MKCPYCGQIDLKVVDSRDSDTGESIRRRRECLQCSKRFTTYERIEAVPLYVMKKDGRREDFDRQKLFSGLMKATAKREISPSTVERVVDEIEEPWSSPPSSASPDFRPGTASAPARSGRWALPGRPIPMW